MSAKQCYNFYAILFLTIILGYSIMVAGFQVSKNISTNYIHSLTIERFKELNCKPIRPRLDIILQLLHSLKTWHEKKRLGPHKFRDLTFLGTNREKKSLYKL